MSVRNARLSDMSSVDTAVWLPPARLAVNTASSARRSRSAQLSDPGVPIASPLLTVRLIT